MLLVNVGELYGFADLESACVGLFESHYHAEKRGFASSVRADDADNSVGRQHEVQVLKEFLLAERLADMLRLDYLISEARTIGNVYLELLFALLLVFVQELVV